MELSHWEGVKILNLLKIKKGFTLIELLLVVAILSILLVVVFAALNPGQRLEDTRDARRWNDVNQILTAIHECVIDNDLAACGLGTTVALSQIGTCGSGGAALCPGAAAVCLNLDGNLELDSYMAGFPVDPLPSASAATTGYAVQVANGIVTVSGCLYEGTTAVSVSR